MRLFIWLILSMAFFNMAKADDIINGDQRVELYESQLINKRVAVFANNSSKIDDQNIVDFLVKHEINIVKVFTPEHGFNLETDAGATVKDQYESANKIKLISLYGKKDKPTPADLKDVDIIVFDIQDVGVRYHTYISSLQKIMEATVENHKPLIILDRANPNSFYIDGPVLQPKYKSFVGMQAIPIVYGMTIGEYAKMLKGEKWLQLTPQTKARQLQLTVIPVANYSHQSKYQVVAKPSPNLPNMTAIYLYPSLGWFEGTQLSIGRGTAMPFQVIGHPDYKTEFSFTPRPISGASNPPLNNQQCFGWDLRGSFKQIIQHNEIDLDYLIRAYQQFPNQKHFFTTFLDKLAGTNQLRQQIIAGYSESQIRASWQPGLNKFKKIRSKYLIYSDN